MREGKKKRSRREKKGHEIGKEAKEGDQRRNALSQNLIVITKIIYLLFNNALKKIK